MKLLLSIFLLALLSLNQQAFAHSDHQSTPISEIAAMQLATDVSTQLSSRDAGLGFGQLAVSWAAIPKQNVSILKKGNDYYIVTVLNVQEKKTLYILMSIGGEVYDANFTGKFKGVE